MTKTISDESNIRALRLPDFNMPKTSLNVIAEMQSINKEIQKYNTVITNFRQKRNKYYTTLYKVPTNIDLPEIIEMSVILEGFLPNAEVLSNYSRNKNRLEKQKPIQVHSKKGTEKLKLQKSKDRKQQKLMSQIRNSVAPRETQIHTSF